jgi:hypothetical protein
VSREQPFEVIGPMCPAGWPGRQGLGLIAGRSNHQLSEITESVLRRTGYRGDKAVFARLIAVQIMLN